MIIAKFGGSSLADAEGFRRVADIIRKNREMRYIVVSAPGKSRNFSCKITDLLYDGREESNQAVMWRFEKIARELGLQVKLQMLKNQLGFYMERQKVAAITRGEYLSAILLGALIDFPVIDARDLIEMNGQGEVQEEETRERIKRALKGEKCAVIPGFYGQNGAGNLCLLPRGGSDFTGSIIAEALEANLYENYTDVSGIFQADPNLFCEAKPIEEITYRELASLAVHGARVLQYESIAPCERGRIPIRVCNSFRPGDAGTMVLDRHGESFSPCYALSGKCHPDSAELFIAAIGNAKCKVFPEKILSFKKEEAEIGMLYRGSKEDFPSAMKSAYAWIAARSG